MMQPDDLWADRYFERAEHSGMLNCPSCGYLNPCSEHGGITIEERE